MGGRNKEDANSDVDVPGQAVSRNLCQSHAWETSDLVELGGVLGGLIEGRIALPRGSRFLGLVSTEPGDVSD